MKWRYPHNSNILDRITILFRCLFNKTFIHDKDEAYFIEPYNLYIDFSRFLFMLKDGYIYVFHWYTNVNMDESKTRYKKVDYSMTYDKFSIIYFLLHFDEYKLFQYEKLVDTRSEKTIDFDKKAILGYLCYSKSVVNTRRISEGTINWSDFFFTHGFATNCIDEWEQIYYNTLKKYSSEIIRTIGA